MIGVFISFITQQMTDTKSNSKMSEQNSAIELKTEAKKTKFDADESTSQMMVPVEAPPNQESLMHILQLNFYCFEQVFEWLTLKDLLNLRLTCKQLKEHADECIRPNYPNFTFGYGRVDINVRNVKQFHQLDPELAKLIKKITFSDVELSDEDVNNLKGILGQIEVLKMEN